jgi:hypothetical protein
MTKSIKLTERPDADTMTIGELWDELALFCDRRAKDNKRSENYPIDTREIQMPALHSLVSAIEKFHNIHRNKPIVVAPLPRRPEPYRIYKVVTSRPRKDGSRLVKSYGCDGKEHYITYDRIWYNDAGVPFSGISRTKTSKYIGKCKHGRDCKNYGFFTDI